MKALSKLLLGVNENTPSIDNICDIANLFKFLQLVYFSKPNGRNSHEKLIFPNIDLGFCSNKN